jgi:hypothetical protein
MTRGWASWPISAYFEDGFVGYDELKDVPWDQKKYAIYWRVWMQEATRPKGLGKWVADNPS